MGKEESFGFTTGKADDTTSPSVISSTPAALANGQPRHFQLSLTFSEAMDQPATEGALSFPSHPGMQGSIKWTSRGSVMTFTPATDPLDGEEIRWNMSTKAMDLAGNPLAGDAQGSFTIAHRVTATLTSLPWQDGTIVNVEGEGRWGFDDQCSIEIGTPNYTYLVGGVARSFLSFDLSQLPPDLVGIETATLSVRQGGPSPSCLDVGKFYVSSVYYGPYLSGTAFDTPVLTAPMCDVNGNCATDLFALEGLCLQGWAPMQTFDVTTKVQQDWLERGTRESLSQFRLRLSVEAHDMFRTLWFHSGDCCHTPADVPKLVVECSVP